MPPRDPSLHRLARAARLTELRSRAADSLARLGRWAPLPLVMAVAALTYVKVARAPLEAAELALVACGVVLAGVLGAAVAAGMGRRPVRHGAALLDRHHGLEGRVASALEFGAVPAAERTPLMELAIGDAVAVARELSPRRAAPLRVPREAPLVAGLVLALVGVAVLEVRAVRIVPATERRIEPLELAEDDLDLFRDAARELDRESRDPAVRAAIGRFNQLLEDVAARRLDRTEAFRRLADLERELEQSADAAREARSEGLSAIARELEESPLARPVARALQERRLRDAEQALRELAEKLAKKRGPPPTPAELERLREAVKRASEASSKRLREATEREAKARDEKQRLLKKKQDGKTSAADERALEKKERELERLGREKRRAEESKREMSQLDRELQRAAEELMRELGAGAEALRRGAEDLNRMAEEELSDSEKRALKKRIEELRELLRQQGQAGRERLRQMQRFAQKARGRAGAGEPGSGDGEAPGEQGSPGGEGRGERPGEGERGEGGEGERGERGEGGEGKGEQPGTGEGKRPGRGSGQGPGELRIGRGPGGKSLRLEGRGERPGPGASGGQGEGGKEPGAGSGRGGEEWGTGSGGDPRGAATDSVGEGQDVAAAGVDTGRGKASSQVIRGAAQRGFVGRGYRKVFRDYQHVAEEQMREDDIPPGYRFYVERYFQLIRPRQ